MRTTMPSGAALQKQALLQHFPLDFPPRPLQEQAVFDIASAFDRGKRFVFFEGPPGVGKSAIAMTLARKYGSAYICTVSKLLQAQYMRDFAKFGMRELYGKTTFPCHATHSPPLDLTRPCSSDCEDGDDKHEGECFRCPYRIDKAKAVLAPFVVANYSSFYYNVMRSMLFKVKGWNPATDGGAPNGIEGSGAFEFLTASLLVLDEGHEVEAVLLDLVSVTFDIGRLPFRVECQSPIGSALIDDYFRWIAKFLETASTPAAKALAERLPTKEKLAFQRLVDRAFFVLKSRHKENWIAEPHPNKKTQGFVLKPLTVRSFGRMLWGDAKRVLIMSATILSAEQMMDSLGIDPAEAAFFSAPCPFPKENRPIVPGDLPMTKQHREDSWPAMLEQIEFIMDEHADEKGLILTPSNEMLEYIKGGLSAKHRGRLISAFGATRRESYEEHLTSEEPTVLIASGMWEGIDLKDDSSRFQIIPALPRPHFSGQIAARAKLDANWYRWRTMTQLIQGVGRSVRNEKDSATTYVLDAALLAEAERRNTMLPEWFREAIE